MRPPTEQSAELRRQHDQHLCVGPRRVEGMEAQLQQYEERSHDRAVALRAILRDDRQM